MSDKIKVVLPSDLTGNRTRQSNPLQDFVTRKELIEGTSNAAIAVGEKMYNQFAQETAEMLTQMEKDITARVMLEVERRTLRGRLRALKGWATALLLRSKVGGWLVELGAMDPFAPQLVAGMPDASVETGETVAVDALEWKAFLFWGPEMLAWLEAGNIALLDRVVQGKSVIAPRLAAQTPPRLREALEQIVGDGNLGDVLNGTENVVQLDGEALAKARHLCAAKFGTDERVFTEQPAEVADAAPVPN